MISITKSGEALSKEHSQIKVLDCTDMPLGHWRVRCNGIELALNVNQTETEPETLIRGHYLFLGVEQGIFVIDLSTSDVINEVRGVSCVQWIDADASDQVIFSAEDELVVLDNTGQLMWRKNFPDIIETTNIENGLLVITDISGGDYKLDVRSGNSL